ncbi:MAG: hypothetical protein PV344_04495 [Anaplasma sp.]|nr:hypothetical protein [Anaplasma sp.]
MNFANHRQLEKVVKIRSSRTIRATCQHYRNYIQVVKIRIRD